MSLIVRSADLRKDRLVLLDALKEHLGVQNNEQRFDWLYLNAAFGTARAWILSDEKGSTIGMAALFPRTFSEAGRTVSGAVLGDFCLARAWRTLGPAIKLQRACLAELTGSPFSMAYDFPSDGMQAIYKRLGCGREMDIVRLSKPLRVDRFVRRVTKRLPGAALLSRAGNAILQWKDEVGGHRNSCDVSPVEGSVAEEFTELAMEMRTEPGIRVLRNAKYLQWRFQKHPYREYEILAARRRGKLHGYLVLAVEADHASIVDLSVDSQPEIFSALVARATAVSRARGSRTISISLSRGHPSTILLRDMGFYEREKRVAIICSQTDNGNSKEWYLTDGDRES